MLVWKRKNGRLLTLNGLLLGALLLNGLSACKKEDGSANERLLQAHNWRRTTEVQTLVLSSGQTQTSTYTSPQTGCGSDGYTTFLGQHQLEVNGGSVLCMNTPQITKGTWYLDHDQRTIISSELTGYEGLWAFTILELTKTTLKVQNTIKSPDRVLTAVTTFVAQ